MRYRELINEDQPRRIKDAGVLPWIEAAYARPDADELFLHGSNNAFDRFKQPNTDWGQLIFATKLTKEYHVPGAALQAEYYGRHLYLLKIGDRKMFSPRNDERAMQIFKDALESNSEKIWDIENKIKYGRIDYQDTHIVVPPAVAAGYNFFRIYEIAMKGDSYGSTSPDMMHIVDRYSSPS